jgi:outer membrane immunogenic protein
MKKILGTGALIAGALLVAGSAMAADLKAPAPMLMKAPPPPVMTWTGCYLDAGAGYGMWNQDHNINSTAGAGGAPNSFVSSDVTNGGRGWLGRFGAGCDYQVSSSWVIGVFGDYDWMNLKGSLSTQLVNAGGGATQADEKETSAWSAGARIGYLITPSILTYVNGGWTQTRFDQMNITNAVGIVGSNAFPAHTYQGWFLGSGFEYAFTWLPINGLFVRSEYRYSTYKRDDLTEFNVNTGLPSGNGGLGNVLHAQKQTQTITTSLVWRFNFGGGGVMSKY